MVLMMSFGSRKVITLNDKLGNDAFIVKDSDGFNVGKITSLGDIQVKGKLTRTTTN